jgi:hypothetical protein
VFQCRVCLLPVQLLQLQLTEVRRHVATAAASESRMIELD